MPEFHISVVANRPAVQAFFEDMCRQDPGIVVTAMRLDACAIAAADNALSTADAAVVDASVDATEALEVFEQIRARWPTLPLGVLFCCPHAATAYHLRAFVAAGAGGFLDLRLSVEETYAALQGLSRGRGVVHLELAQGSNTALSEALGTATQTDLSDHDLGLLKLVKLGLTDCEIGRQLYLSPHTVKHRIERLRERAQARNRVQLAAWAAHRDALRGERDPAAPEHAYSLGWS